MREEVPLAMYWGVRTRCSIYLEKRWPPAPVVSTMYLQEPLVKTKIIRIGNSQGIRIPKALLELTGLAG